jgi:hypothetical protein
VCIPEAGAQIERAASLATNRRKMRDQLLLNQSSNARDSNLVQGKGSRRSFVSTFDDKMKESSDAVPLKTLDDKARDKLPYNKAMKTSDMQAYKNNDAVVKVGDMQSYNNHDNAGDTQAYNEGIQAGDAQPYDKRQETYDDKGSSSGRERRGEQGKGSGRSFTSAHAGKIAPLEGNEEIGLEQILNIQQYHRHQLMSLLFERDITVSSSSSSMTTPPEAPRQEDEEEEWREPCQSQPPCKHEIARRVRGPPAEEEKEKEEEAWQSEEEQPCCIYTPAAACKHEIARRVRGPLADTPQRLRSDQEEAHGGGGEGGGGEEALMCAEALFTHTPLYARAPAGRAFMCECVCVCVRARAWVRACIRVYHKVLMNGIA